MTIPFVWPGSADTRSTDPFTSHAARDGAKSSRDTARAVEAALHAAGGPVTSDTAYRLARQLGFVCTPQRVRTVLKEQNKGPWARLATTGLSDNGNPAHLWALIEGD